MGFSALTRAAARSSGDDAVRAGVKALAGSVDEIGGRVKALIDQGFDPDTIIEARKRWESGDLNYNPSDPRLGSKKGGLLLGDDIHTQHPSVEAMDAKTASDKARNSILRKDNPIFNPDEVRLDEPVAKRYESSIRDENLELSNRGRTKLE